MHHLSFSRVSARNSYKCAVSRADRVSKEVASKTEKVRKKSVKGSKRRIVPILLKHFIIIIKGKMKLLEINCLLDFEAHAFTKMQKY